MDKKKSAESDGKSHVYYEGAVFILAILSLIVMCAVPDSVYGQLSVSYFAGFIVWILTVFIPQQLRRRVMRAQMMESYYEFKCRLCDLFQQCIFNENSQKPIHSRIRIPQNATEIWAKDYQKLNDFLFPKVGSEAGENSAFYAILNGLDNNILKELYYEMERFVSECNAFVNTNPTISRGQIRSYHFLVTRLMDMQHKAIYKSDPAKYVVEPLLMILCRWSYVDGQRTNDWVEDVIKNL